MCHDSCIVPSLFSHLSEAASLSLRFLSLAYELRLRSSRVPLLGCRVRHQHESSIVVVLGEIWFYVAYRDLSHPSGVAEGG